MMKCLAAVVAFPLALGSGPAAAAEDISMPEFIKQTFPEAAQKAAWAEEQAVMNPKGALDGKTKHLIALGVAAQIRLRILCLLSRAGGQGSRRDRSADQGGGRGSRSNAQMEHSA